MGVDFVMEKLGRATHRSPSTLLGADRLFESPARSPFEVRLKSIYHIVSLQNRKPLPQRSPRSIVAPVCSQSFPGERRKKMWGGGRWVYHTVDPCRAHSNQTPKLQAKSEWDVTPHVAATVNSLSPSCLAFKPPQLRGLPTN